MNFLIKKISYNDKKDLFEVEFEADTAYLTYEELEDFKLSKGDLVDLALYKKILILSEKNLALDDALKYISSRFVSSFKVKTKLIKKGYEKEIIDIVIEILEKKEIIDDKVYIEYYIKDKKDINHRSKKHIYYDLIHQGFNEEDINISIENYELEEEIKVAWELLKSKNYLDRKTPQQIRSYLIRRGFDFDTVGTVMDELE